MFSFSWGWRLSSPFFSLDATRLDGISWVWHALSEKGHVTGSTKMGMAYVSRNQGMTHSIVTALLECEKQYRDSIALIWLGATRKRHHTRSAKKSEIRSTAMEFLAYDTQLGKDGMIRILQKRGMTCSTAKNGASCFRLSVLVCRKNRDDRRTGRGVVRLCWCMSWRFWLSMVCHCCFWLRFLVTTG